MKAGIRLEEVLKAIKPLDEEAMKAAQTHSDGLTKPPGSLGTLEEVAAQLAGIGGAFPIAVRKKAIIVMAGDHGVCEEGVSAFPQEVTPQMVLNFLSGGAAVNVLGRHAGADVVCVDIGVKSDIDHPNLIVRKVRYGTDNIARGPAMSREEAVQAIEAGIAVVDELAAQGYELFAAGEMGIGNTTPSAAMLQVLGGVSSERAVGRGTGIDDSSLLRKRTVINLAIAVNAPDAGDPLDVLSKLGGLEIAGMTGIMLGAAANRCPVVIDGFIASLAALVAYRLAPLTRGYMIASHLSHESGHAAVLEQLGLSPMVHLSMRVGEGTGAAIGMTIIDAAVKLMQEMATFESAGVSKG
jgi:nicotinate-nucleotide--dimethylbenzimidazole phosphoribosyltransferase